MNTLCKLNSINNISKLRFALGIRSASSVVTKPTKIDNKKESNQTEYEVNPNYLNRNPRNLEWSGHAHKRLGWHLHYPPKDYYHKCFLELRNWSIGARVEHFSGKTIIQVSSNDWPIKKHLYSLRDTSAVINVAKLLADRCHKYGITQMRFFEDLYFEKSKKKQAFYKTLVDCGIKFEEPEYISGESNMPGLDYENKNFFHEKRNIPFPPTVNKLKTKLLSEAEALLQKKSK